MEQRYYIQTIARNFLRSITEDPSDMKVHPRFLGGLGKQEFIEGYKELLALFRRLYGDISKEPAAFNMPLVEITEDNPKNASYTKSCAGFCRMPNLLLALGTVSELSGSTLTATGEALLEAVKVLKITNAAQLLVKLGEYGFELTGIGKTVKAGDIITVGYPDLPALVTALKAMADAKAELVKGDLRKSKDYFYILVPDLLANETVKAPKLSVERLLQSLEPEQRPVAESLHKIAAARSTWICKTQGLMRGSWKCVYTEKASKMVLLTLASEQGKLSVKLNLQHIGGYIGIANRYPDGFKDKIKTSGWPCSRCHDSCMGGFVFSLDGKDYNKCRVGAFTFDDSGALAGELRYYEELLEHELAVR